jgi:DNA-directed RNA polymerase subunit RPC12/RpoP
MAQTSRQATLFRFRCPKCNIRLKVDAADRGKNIVCPQCQNTIVAQRSPRQGMPEESVIRRLDESVDQWVRTMCSCGKLVKAPATFAGRTGHCPYCSNPVTMPALGETMSSALEVSTFVQAPSEESLLMAVDGPDFLDQQPSSPQITYSRASPADNEPKDDPYARAVCLCGAQVQADLEMAGKSTPCPKCGTLLYFHKKPTRRPVVDFDAMGRRDLDFQGESVTFKPHMVSARQSVFREIDFSKEVKAVISQPEWDNEKKSRARRIRSLRSRRSAIAKPRAPRPPSSIHKITQALRVRPLMVLLIALAILACAIALLIPFL